MKTFKGLYRRIISSAESFFQSLIVFKILAENCKRHHLKKNHHILPHKTWSEYFFPVRTFVGNIIRIISWMESVFPSIVVFKILAENCKIKPIIFGLSRLITNKESPHNFDQLLTLVALQAKKTGHIYFQVIVFDIYVRLVT